MTSILMRGSLSGGLGSDKIEVIAATGLRGVERIV